MIVMEFSLDGLAREEPVIRRTHVLLKLFAGMQRRRGLKFAMTGQITYKAVVWGAQA